MNGTDRKDYDVIVAGGGPAGIGAAAAAALSVKEGCTPRQLPFQKVQDRLREMGVEL